MSALKLYFTHGFEVRRSIQRNAMIQVTYSVV